LEFSDIGTGAANADLVLDTVAVSLPTPTPSPTATPGSTPTALPLNNGSFESPPEFTLGTVTGWTVGGNMQVAATTEGATDGTHSATLSAGGDSQNDTLSQTFITMPGQAYNLDFDAGVYGITQSNLQLQARVTGNNTLFSETFAPPYAGTNNSNQVQFQHYHYTFTADSTVATLQFTDFLLGNKDADIVVDDVSIAPQPPSYAQWRTSHFTVGQQADPNISGWSADPDHDGIPNGLEYFFNTDPMAGIPAAQAGAVPMVSIQSSGGSRYLFLNFRRLIGWSGNPVVVAVSDNLATWDTNGNQVETVGTPTPAGDGITEIVTVRIKNPITPGMPRRFMRLQLSQ
jgi:hypothetical protein